MVRMSVGSRNPAEIAAVDEMDVEMPIVVVVEKESTGSHCFREVFLFRCAVGVFEMDAGLLCLIRKIERCFSGGRYRGTDDKYQVGE